ncbi:hypothetical protein BHE74_00021519, partial [Ensete ventricosum]
MLETTLVALQDITLEKIFVDQGGKTLFTEFPHIIQQLINLTHSVGWEDVPRRLR